MQGSFLVLDVGEHIGYFAHLGINACGYDLCTGCAFGYHGAAVDDVLLACGVILVRCVAAALGNRLAFPC